MRIFLGLALLIGGLGLCLLDALTHAFVKARSAKYYYEQLRAFPEKGEYRKTEVADAVWQVWTNRAVLPQQVTYNVEELKGGLLKTVHVFGTDQDSCSRSGFEYAIAQVSGYEKNRDENGLTVVGFLGMLAGAFVLGGAFRPRRPISAHETSD